MTDYRTDERVKAARRDAEEAIEFQGGFFARQRHISDNEREKLDALCAAVVAAVSGPHKNAGRLKSIEAVPWALGPAKNPEDFGRFPKPDKPSPIRGIWTLDGRWVADCTDFRTALDAVEGHNGLLDNNPTVR